MADTSPNLAFKRLAEGQDDAEVFVNEAFNIVDAILRAGIEDRDLSAAPTGVNGEVYLVKATPSGGDPWETYTDYLAAYYDGWIFIAPLEGMRVWVKDEDLEIIYDGAAWTPVAQRLSVTNSITAYATGGQANATQLVNEVNRITTVGTSGDSVKLPTPVPGMRVTVINDGANSCDVFPTTGAQIDSNGVNGADALAAGGVITYFAITTTLWRSLLGA